MVTLSQRLTNEIRRTFHFGHWVDPRTQVVRIGTEKRIAFCRWHVHHLKHPPASALLHSNLCCLQCSGPLRSLEENLSQREGGIINYTKLETFKLNFYLACTRFYLSAQLAMNQIESDIF